MVDEVNDVLSGDKGAEDPKPKNKKIDGAVKWAKGALEDVDNFAEKHTKGREFDSKITHRDEKIVDAVVNGTMKHFSKGKNFKELATAAGYGEDDIKNMSKEQRKSLVESFGDALHKDLEAQIKSDERTKDNKFTERELRSVIRDGLESVSLADVRVTVDKDGKKVADGAAIKGEDGKTDLTKDQNGKTHVNLNDEDGKGKDDNKFYTRAETKLGRAAQTQVGEAVITAGATAALGVVGLSSVTAGALAGGLAKGALKTVLPDGVAGLAGRATKLGLDSSVVGTILTQAFANTDEPLSIKGKANDVKENIGDLKDRFLDKFRKDENKKHHAPVLTAGTQDEVEDAAKAKIEERKKERDAKANEPKLADKLDDAVKKAEDIVGKVDAVVSPQAQTVQSKIGENSVLKPAEVEKDKEPKAEIPSFINLPKAPKPEVNDVQVPFRDKRSQLDAESTAQNPTTGKKSFEQVVGELGSKAEDLGEKALNGVADAAKGAANSVTGFFKVIKDKVGRKDNSGGVENATEGNQKIDTSKLMADQSTAGYAIKGEVPKEPSIVSNPFSVKQEPPKNEKMPNAPAPQTDSKQQNKPGFTVGSSPYKPVERQNSATELAKVAEIELPKVEIPKISMPKQELKSEKPEILNYKPQIQHLEPLNKRVEEPVVENKPAVSQPAPSYNVTPPVIKVEPVKLENTKPKDVHTFSERDLSLMEDKTQRPKDAKVNFKSVTLPGEDKPVVSDARPSVGGNKTEPKNPEPEKSNGNKSVGVAPATAPTSREPLNQPAASPAEPVIQEQKLKVKTTPTNHNTGINGGEIQNVPAVKNTATVNHPVTAKPEKPAFEVNFNKNGGFEVKNLSGNEAKFKDALQKASGMEPAAFEKAYSYMQDCKFKFSDKAMQDIGGVNGHKAHELAEKQVARDQVSNNPTAAYTAYKDLMGKILDNQGLNIKCEGAVVSKDDAARIVATTGFGNLADKHHKKMENIANGCKDVELSK
jgi:hypothetical protein